MRWWWVTLGLGLGLAVAGCSSKTSAPVTCDNSGLRLLAFASDRRQAAGHTQIWLYDLDAQGYHLLRNLASPSAIDSTPSISSDGQLIAFTRSDTTGSTPHILIYERASCGFVPQDGLVAGHDRDPAFSGDALHLAFDRDTLGHRRIRMLQAGGKLAPIGHLGNVQPFDDWQPSPNSNGSRIAFVSNRVSIQSPDGSPSIYVYDVPGDSLLALPGMDSVGVEVDPSLSSDGRFMCFASDRAGGKGGFDLYIYDVQTHTLTRLDNANSPQDERRPAIRPGGGAIAFESTRAGGGGGMDIWLFSLGGAAPSQGADLPSAGQDLQPSVFWP